jgi:hypothetical protein
MCNPALAALAISAVGTGVQYDAQQKAGYKQQFAIDQAKEEDSILASKRQDAVAQAASNTFKPTTTENFVKPAQDRLEGVAQQAQIANSASGTPSAGVISQDYITDRARKASDDMKRAITNAQLQAKAGAGQRMMAGNSLNLADGLSTADDIGSLMRQAKNRNGVNIDRAGRVNQAQLALGSLISGAGSAAAGYKRPGTQSPAPIENRTTP